ncbi:hypothetical protein [Bifidobacterium vansinderenii]|uniref:Uncharacterized protein n=1 Tax=Bifidobacterium vansinderenii TaxID=1984871 RepID=A0A229W1C0_9BIFI|nr:hypothetical protein [Bifidobacterium vansinderenii]OXN01626.1 hypothetical protein Tam10B_0068 [Bifidobacterium vansinderenii]
MTRARLRRLMLVSVIVFTALGLLGLMVGVHDMDGYGILRGLVVLTCAWLVALSRERL